MDLAAAVTERTGGRAATATSPWIAPAASGAWWPAPLVLKDMRGATIGCVIHLRDVTERMLMKEQMWRMERFVSLGTLASGLHHEIKNPMTALSIHVQLLEERLGDDRADEPVRTS